MVPDYLILFGFITIGALVLTWVYDFFEFVYWKYVDWKYGDKEKVIK